MPTETTRLVIRSELKRALKDIKKLNKELLKSAGVSKKTAKGFKGMNMSFLKSAIGIAALGMAFKKVVKDASNLQEVTSKFTTVFGEQIEVAKEYEETLVSAYAMSTREARQYLSSVQDLLVPMGMAKDSAAVMSGEVVKLAADLGSFNNMPTERVMMDIQSALVGNFETMKKYGVVLNETVLKEEARTLGLYKGKGMIDANTKALVAYNLMVKGSEAAIGDMIRTQESWANVSKKISSRFEEISARLGQELLPSLGLLGQAFLNTTKDGSVLIIGLQGIVKAIGFVIKSYAKVISIMGFVQAKMQQKVAVDVQKDWAKALKGVSKEAINTFGSLKRMDQEAAKGNLIAKDMQKRYDKVSTGFKAINNESKKYASRMLDNANIIKGVTDKEIGNIQKATAARQKSSKAIINELIAKQRAAGVKAIGAKGGKSPAAAEAENLNKLKELKTDYYSYIGDLESANITKEEVEYEQRLTRLQEFQNNQLISEEEAMTMREGLEDAHQAKIREMKSKTVEAEYAQRQATLKNYIQSLGLNLSAYQTYSSFMLANLNKSNKKEFMAWKAFAIAQAIGDTFRAAVGAYSAMAAIPIVGPALGAVAAATAVALGMRNVNNIRKQKMQKAEEGVLIKGSQRGTPIIMGDGGKDEIAVPFQNEAVMERFRESIGAGGGPNVVINVENLYAAGDSDILARDIDESLAKLVQDKSSLLAEAL